MHDKQVRRRRAVLVLLVAVSLILLTAYFGETPSSPLHNVQRGVVEVLSPIEQGASTVLAPVRSVASWVSDTLHAKSQVKELQTQVRSLNQQLAQAKGAEYQNRQLSNLVHLDNSIGVQAYHPVTAQVIARDPLLWYQTVEVDKGSDDGVQIHDPVIADKALVGEVSEVSPTASWVSLITDHTVSVTARVTDANGDTGELVPAVGNPNQLVLQYVQPPNPAQIDRGPQQNDLVVTAGFRSSSLESYFPANIPIGTVAPVNENQLFNDGQVHVTPAADLRHFDVAQILTNPQPGTERAQVP
ncbi:MAG TPA: rod shape-determining protein MreC [Solirubrobacteraceae bacterium]|nr:rod shape-determining protein MreC [Solirubrobacteraceae bacterium]